MQPKSITIHPGTVFGRLAVIQSFMRGNGFVCICTCECSPEITREFPQHTLVSGHTQSCGCKRGFRGRYTHRMSKTREYKIWVMMKDRCTNPRSAAYELYGGRGITVCDRWDNFEEFIADMGWRPSPQHTLDRIDNNKGYCPDNCRWATVEQQVNNRSNTVVVVFQGNEVPIQRLARMFNLSATALRKRILERGWTVERAVTTPLRITKATQSHNR